MAIKVEHELHGRRRGRNLWLGAILLAFVAMVFGLTVVKVQNGQGAALQGYDHAVQVTLEPAPATDGETTTEPAQ